MKNPPPGSICTSRLAHNLVLDGVPITRFDGVPKYQRVAIVGFPRLKHAVSRCGLQVVCYRTGFILSWHDPQKRAASLTSHSVASDINASTSTPDSVRQGTVLQVLHCSTVLG